MRNSELSVRRPTLLNVGMWASATFGVLLLLSLLLAPLNIATYSVNDEAVTGPEFLRAAGISVLVIAAFLIAISITLFVSAESSRYLMLLFWPAMSLVGVITSRTMEADYDCTWVLATPVAVWYLFFRKNVVAYYDAILDAKEGARGA